MHANRGSAHFLTLLSCVQATRASPGQYCPRQCWSEGATNPTRCGGDELWDEMEELFTMAICMYAALVALPIGFLSLKAHRHRTGFHLRRDSGENDIFFTVVDTLTRAD